MKLSKKTAYDKLAAKSNTTDTSGFVLITKYDTDKSNLEKKSRTLTRKYLMLVGLFKKDHNAKITEIEGKMPSVTGLVTTASLNGVENKAFHICVLVSRKQIITQQYQTWNLNILLHLIIINLLVKYLMQR